MTQKRTITAEDLYNFELLSPPRISPDGKYVVYAQQRADAKTEKKHSNLWIASTDGSGARQFTFGDQNDSQPRWSPDGKTIAFISNRGDEKQPQIYLIPFAGGEARALTELKGEIGALEWSPDGKQFAIQFRAKDAEALERDEDEQKKKLGIVARHYERVFYKFDGYGFLPHERWHIWTLDASSGAATQLTEGPVFDELEPTWSPDSQWIAYTSNRNPDPDLARGDTDLFIIPAAGGDERKIETNSQVRLPCFSPDGKWLAYIGQRDYTQWWQNNDLWVAAVDGSAPPRNLTAAFDATVDTASINDLNFGHNPQAPIWSPNGEKLYFQVSKDGSNLLMSANLSSGELETVLGEKGFVGGFEFDRAGEMLAYFFGTMTDPGQIFVHPVGGQDSTQVTQANPWLQDVNLGSMEEVWFKGRDGNDLQGWILKPPAFDSSQKYPSILEIHGGPLAMYAEFFMHEFYYLAAQGYVVYFSNPRGGQGYGETHAKAIWQDWGNADYADLMSWTDYVAAQPYIDTQRMGVTGGSYGGYMSLWIIGHTRRFQAAVPQRVVSNFISMWGSSDLNWIFQQVLDNKPPWEDLEKYWKHSPMAYIGNAKTPTLIIHSENDHRCPIEQGEQAFVALKTLGVDAEFVRFPEEPHGLSRIGRTDRRIARLNHIARWMDTYLK
ncbi:MAG: S9 family peptidase [Anaerolineales bacterium]|nr:S9 family peptidase [Anaerolineales bacterium]